MLMSSRHLRRVLICKCYKGQVLFQHMYQQNNEFRNRINAMQSDVDNLRKRIDTLRAELDDEENEDE